ncbi:hypothetical protein DIURU_000535 [Diutina rugosa]|uniref:Uncharacterized protein n=1 Tax=Diutina rugosa TaxID=5481 RepID=A0A642V496_DIURU|nr:uncharacterized protein DIURU_000535 [Diutina rugosa]KAA8907478.1 hypothetical protein DIURU_000535 [Diutina rugosa]
MNRSFGFNRSANGNRRGAASHVPPAGNGSGALSPGQTATVNTESVDGNPINRRRRRASQEHIDARYGRPRLSVDDLLDVIDSNLPTDNYLTYNPSTIKELLAYYDDGERLIQSIDRIYRSARRSHPNVEEPGLVHLISTRIVLRYGLMQSSTFKARSLLMTCKTIEQVKQWVYTNDLYNMKAFMFKRYALAHPRDVELTPSPDMYWTNSANTFIDVIYSRVVAIYDSTSCLKIHNALISYLKTANPNWAESYPLEDQLPTLKVYYDEPRTVPTQFPGRPESEHETTDPNIEGIASIHLGPNIKGIVSEQLEGIDFSVFETLSSDYLQDPGNIKKLVKRFDTGIKVMSSLLRIFDTVVAGQPKFNSTQSEGVARAFEEKSGLTHHPTSNSAEMLYSCTKRSQYMKWCFMFLITPWAIWAKIYVYFNPGLMDAGDRTLTKLWFDHNNVPFLLDYDDFFMGIAKCETWPTCSTSAANVIWKLMSNVERWWEPRMSSKSLKLLDNIITRIDRIDNLELYDYEQR